MMPDGVEVIVVDDDKSMSLAIKRLLDAAGLKCRSFQSAEEFRDSDANTTADVLILDIQLPGISGLELLRQLKANGNAPPAIFITGHDRPNNRELAIRSGASAYFAKPFSGGELIQAIQNSLPAA